MDAPVMIQYLGNWSMILSFIKQKREKKATQIYIGDIILEVVAWMIQSQELQYYFCWLSFR